MRDRLVVIDLGWLAMRCCTQRAQNLTSPSGLNTTGPFAFVRALFSLCDYLQPTHFAVARDTHRATGFRRALYAPYKANRPAYGIDLSDQLRVIDGLLSALDTPVISCTGYEADDLLYSACKQFSADCQVVGVSGDKDLMQLVNQKTGTKLYTSTTETWWDEKAVTKKWGVAPNRIADVQALAGDSGDGIPGIEQIGLKKAVLLVQTYGNLRNVAEAAVSGCKKWPLSDKLREKVAEAHTSGFLKLMYKLVKLRAVDLPFGLDELVWDGFDFEGAQELFTELGFASLLKH